MKPFRGNNKRIFSIHSAQKKDTLISWDCPFNVISFHQFYLFERGPRNTSQYFLFHSNRAREGKGFYTCMSKFMKHLPNFWAPPILSLALLVWNINYIRKCCKDPCRIALQLPYTYHGIYVILLLRTCIPMNI